jgi:electron transport complex protein RnfC
LPSFDAIVFKAWPAPKELSVELSGPALQGLKRGRTLSQGQLLSLASSPFLSDVHAPLNGRLISLIGLRAQIEVDPNLSGLPPSPISLDNLFGKELEDGLKKLGVEPLLAPELGDPVIISALVPQPGLEAAEALWVDQRSTLEVGAAVLKRLWPDRELVEVLSPSQEPLGLGRVERYKATYPLTLPILVKRTLLGSLDLLKRGVVEPWDLWALGVAVRSGYPVTHLPVSINKSYYLVPLGLKISSILSQVNLRPMRRDVLVLGGLMSGRPVARLDRGLGKNFRALNLIKAALFSDRPGPCRYCRLCRLACPLDLPINILASQPLSLWPQTAAKLGSLLDGCLSCACCALACPSRRPLVDFVGLAKPQGLKGRHL